MGSIARKTLQQLTESERQLLRDPKRTGSGWKQLEAAFDAHQKALPMDVDGTLHLPTTPTIWGLHSAYVLSSICILVATQLLADHRLSGEPRRSADSQTTAVPWSKTRVPNITERQAIPVSSLCNYPSTGPAALSQRHTASTPNSDNGRQATNTKFIEPSSQTSLDSKAEASTFDAEFQLIRKAKQALDAGSPRLALDTLSEHNKLFRTGVFRAEREGLRVLSLCMMGNSPMNRLEAVRYLQLNRQMPMVDRIRRECKLEDQRNDHFR